MKIPLNDWAAKHWSPPPSDWVLRKWCREGEIHPPPERVGRKWYVEDRAQRITQDTPIGGGLVPQLVARGK